MANIAFFVMTRNAQIAKEKEEKKMKTDSQERQSPPLILYNNQAVGSVMNAAPSLKKPIPPKIQIPNRASEAAKAQMRWKTENGWKPNNKLLQLNLV